MRFFFKDCGLVILTLFKTIFYEENKHAFVKSNLFFSASYILLDMYANSIEHLIQAIWCMHFSKALMRTKVALQEVSFGWLID